MTHPLLSHTFSRFCGFAVFFAVLGGSAFAAQQPKVLAPHKPVAPRVPRHREWDKPAVPQISTGALWMIDANFKSTLYLDNILTDQPATLNLGVNWVQFFEFSLASQKGSVIRGRPQRNDGLSSQAAELVVGSGENHEQELLLDQWFDFDSPGRYSLKARLGTPTLERQLPGQEVEEAIERAPVAGDRSRGRKKSIATRKSIVSSRGCI